MSAERNGNGNGRVAIDNDNGTKRDETERNAAKRNATERNGSERALPSNNGTEKTFSTRFQFRLLAFALFSTLWHFIFPHLASLLYQFFLFYFFFCCLRVCALSLAEIEIETEAFPLLFNAN